MAANSGSRPIPVILAAVGKPTPCRTSEMPVSTNRAMPALAGQLNADHGVTMPRRQPPDSLQAREGHRPDEEQPHAEQESAASALCHVDLACSGGPHGTHPVNEAFPLSWPPACLPASTGSLQCVVAPAPAAMQRRPPAPPRMRFRSSAERACDRAANSSCVISWARPSPADGRGSDLDVCQYRCDDHPAVIGHGLSSPSSMPPSWLAMPVALAILIGYQYVPQGDGGALCSTSAFEGEGGAFVLIQLCQGGFARRLPPFGRAHRAGSRAVRRARSWRWHHSSGSRPGPTGRDREEQGLTHGAGLVAARHAAPVEQRRCELCDAFMAHVAAGTVERQAECL